MKKHLIYLIVLLGGISCTYQELHKNLEEIQKNANDKVSSPSQKLSKSLQQAVYFYERGNYTQALARLLNAEDSDRKYTLMGAIKAEQRDFDNAKQWYQSALTKRIELYGSKHTKVAAIYNNLGNVLLMQKYYKQALAYFQKALRIGTHKGAIYNNIGNVYYAQRKHATATYYYLLANKHYTSQYQHYSGYNLACSQQQKGELIKAQKLLEQVLQQRLKLFGQQHYLVSQVYNSLAYNAYKQGNQKKATQYIQLAKNNIHVHYPTQIETNTLITIIYDSKYERAYTGEGGQRHNLVP